jgi:hypothetical protein
MPDRVIAAVDIQTALGSPFAIGGPTLISGPYALTLTLTGVTSLVFPTTGTLATLPIHSSDISDFSTAVAAASVVSSKALAAVTANGQSFNLPAGAVITQALITETAGFAVNVGLGTTPADSDVMPVMPIGARGSLVIPQTSFSLLTFTGLQALYPSSTAWGGASINLKVWYAI